MPAPGTRRVEIDGQKQYLPAEEAELEELLNSGCALQDQLAVQEKRLKAIRQRLCEIAEQRRGDAATVKLEALSGAQAVVTWARQIEVDPARAERLKDRLGPAWGQLFNTRTTYTMSRGYKQWMRKQQPADLERAKKEIGAAFQVNEKAPGCKLIPVGTAG